MKKKLPRWSALAALGLIALALLIGLGIFLGTQDTEVEQLMEILAAGDPADAVWAFEKLKVVDCRDLDQFLPYLPSTRPTPLEHMVAMFDEPPFMGGASEPVEPFDLSRVAQFILSIRLTGGIAVDGDDPGPHLVSRWRKEIESSKNVQCRKLGFLEYWFGRHVFLQPRIVPPSRDTALARPAKDFDVEGLLEILRSGRIPEVMWALEVLELAPDDRLDLLLPQLGATEKIAVRFIGASGGRLEFYPDGRSLGGVLRFILWTRLGLEDPTVWTEDSPSPQALDALRAAWIAHRRRAG